MIESSCQCGNVRLYGVRIAASCFSHWESITPNSKSDRMGVNTRLITNLDVSSIRVRRFDGADT